MPSIRDVLLFIGRSSRRVAVTVVGGAVTLAGLAMLVLPGPGFLVIVVGLAILATEYAWAAVMLDKAKGMAERGGRVAKGAVRGAAGRVRRGRGPQQSGE
jgi:hypothetical protein